MARRRVGERCGGGGMMRNILSPCWKESSLSSSAGVRKEEEEEEEGCFERNGGGDYSVAVVQANRVLEDQCQLEFGPFGSFFGVYDGHGGPDASRFLRDRLFPNFIHAISTENCGDVTTETIRKAFLKTEKEFTDIVSEIWTTYPNLATVGSCCLVGVISQQTLFVANVGDSRVVLGKKSGRNGAIGAVQLSKEHNANIEEIRRELKELHPNDPQIVVLKHGVWRVKGIIQVSRSIGDVYLKQAQYNKEPIHGKFRFSEPLNKPVMSATPSIISHPLEPNDSFLIFASDGLWEHLSNEMAVDIVRNRPCTGSAKRLIRAALEEAARKREMRYSDLRKIDIKIRRHFHDDITVIVVFLNHDHNTRGMACTSQLSIRCPLELV